MNNVYGFYFITSYGIYFVNVVSISKCNIYRDCVHKRQVSACIEQSVLFSYACEAKSVLFCFHMLVELKAFGFVFICLWSEKRFILISYACEAKNVLCYIAVCSSVLSFWFSFNTKFINEPIQA